MRKVSISILASATVAYAAITTGAFAAATCPSGYISVDMPDVEISDTCDTGYTSAGTIEDCSTGAGVCTVADITCEAGYYPKDGSCTECDTGYYCPDGKTIVHCPEDPGNLGGQIHSYNNAAGTSTGATKLSDCMLINIPLQSAKHGNLIYRCYYNTTEKRYNKTCHFITNNNWLQKCDAGYYWVIPNNPSSCFDTQGNCTNCAECDCLTVGYGYYSPQNTAERTACGTGYSTRTETAVSVNECVPLCAAGATQLHVGPHTFNLYPDSACERPAVHIGLPDGICCAHLVKGEVSGAMHVRYNDEVYHTTN